MPGRREGRPSGDSAATIPSGPMKREGPMPSSPEEMAAAMIANLEESGSFNAMVSHRVRLSEQKDVNKELPGWLRQAYEAS